MGKADEEEKAQKYLNNSYISFAAGAFFLRRWRHLFYVHIELPERTLPEDSKTSYCRGIEGRHNTFLTEKFETVNPHTLVRNNIQRSCVSTRFPQC